MGEIIPGVRRRTYWRDRALAAETRLRESEQAVNAYDLLSQFAEGLNEQLEAAEARLREAEGRMNELATTLVEARALMVTEWGWTRGVGPVSERERTALRIIDRADAALAPSPEEPRKEGQSDEGQTAEHDQAVRTPEATLRQPQTGRARNPLGRFTRVEPREGSDD